MSCCVVFGLCGVFVFVFVLFLVWYILGVYKCVDIVVYVVCVIVCHVCVLVLSVCL